MKKIIYISLIVLSSISFLTFAVLTHLTIKLHYTPTQFGYSLLGFSMSFIFLIFFTIKLSTHNYNLKVKS